MKSRLSLLLMAIIFIAWSCCETEETENYILTFSIDMSDVELTETDTVGIRGNVAPFSWTESYALDGPDENGVYTASIPFSRELECGTRILYKYIVSDSIWDNDVYGEYGNRLYTFCCADAKLSVDKWNELKEFTMESMLTLSAWDELISLIYTIGLAKEHGMSMDELAQHMVDFWDWQNPYQDIGAVVRFYRIQQSKSTFGSFELIMQTPEKAEFIINKNWEQMVYIWNSDGVIKGVSVDEITELFKRMSFIYMDLYGLKLEWQETEDNKVRYIIEK